MAATKDKQQLRERRRARIRARVAGTQERPRLAVFKSDKHLYAQLIDDTEHHTIASYSTLQSDAKGKSNSEAAKAIGKKIAELAKKKGIERVVFDRGGFIYTGNIKTLADAAREAGLAF